MTREVGARRSRSEQGSARADGWLSCVLEGELEEMKRENMVCESALIKEQIKIVSIESIKVVISSSSSS